LQGNRLNQVIDEVSEAVAYETEDTEEFEIFGNAGYDFHTKSLVGRLFLQYQEPVMGLSHRKHIIQSMAMQHFNNRCLEECVGNNMKLGLGHRKHIIQYMAMQRFNNRCLEECVGNNMKLR